MQCVRCGKEIEEGPLCTACISSTAKLLISPAYIDIVKCPNCSRFRCGRDLWVQSIEEAVEKILRSSVRIHPAIMSSAVEFTLNADKWEGRIVISMNGEIDGEEIHEEVCADLRIHSEVCERCSRIAGNYYEAIIQLRGKRRLTLDDFNAAMAIVEESSSDGTFLTRAERTRGGWDFYVSSQNWGRSIAKRLAECLGARVRESSKLVGVRDGRKVFRITFLVRAPQYRKGSIVMMDGRPRIIHSVGKSVKLTDLMTGEMQSVHMKKLEHVRVLADPEDHLEAIVVSKGPEGVQILDPVTNRTVTVLTPFDVRSGDTVRVARFDDEIVILPQE